MTTTDRVLGDHERRTLSAVCEAFFPRLPATEGDDPALFALSASDVGLTDAVEEAMVVLSARQRRELRLFIRLLDNRVFMLWAAGRFAGFASMDPESRESALRALSISLVPDVRSGYQALKRLSTFLFYSVLPDGRTNPAWPGIGYRVPAPARATSALRLTRVTAPTTLEADVCVVGSGAGGGVAAARLAAAGKTVVVLEAGPPDQSEDYDQREIVGMQRLYLEQGTTASRDLGVAMLAGSGIGGGTSINWQTSLRTPEYILEEWAHRSGIRMFVEPGFQSALDAVCARLGVSTDESARNGNNAPLARGCDVRGFQWSEIPRNARGCDLTQCGFCVFGCRVGGKQSTMNTYLRDAEETGRARVVPSCRADRVLRREGHVTGVLATVRDGSGASVPIQVHAKTVVVAAGALETPALLLRSGLDHPQLGRNLYLHPTTAVAGRYEQRVEGWIGAPQSVLCDHFGRRRGNFGYRFETAPVHPGLISLAQPWHGARDHRRRMQGAAHLSAFIVLTRDRAGGRVTVDAEGRAVTRYGLGRLERELLREGQANAARIHHAAGAAEIHTLHVRDHTYRRAAHESAADFAAYCDRIATLPVHGNRCGVFSAHQMGTARMGTDSRRDVCDETGAVRGVRGLYVSDTSLFPASSGVNPMLTVMALAHVVSAAVATR